MKVLKATAKWAHFPGPGSGAQIPNEGFTASFMTGNGSVPEGMTMNLTQADDFALAPSGRKHGQWKGSRTWRPFMNQVIELENQASANFAQVTPWNGYIALETIDNNTACAYFGPWIYLPAVIPMGDLQYNGTGLNQLPNWKVTITVQLRFAGLNKGEKGTNTLRAKTRGEDLFKVVSDHSPREAAEGYIASLITGSKKRDLREEL